MPDTPPVHLLLVEDDPVSAAFLVEALSSLPARIDQASCLAEAHALASTHPHALWLVDANLPDGSGEAWLRKRRQSGQITPALALTAELFRERLDSLIDAGYSEALQKPLAVASLHAAVRRALGQQPQLTIPASAEKLPVWDEQRALAALGGDMTALRNLRGLFLNELPQQRDGVMVALAAGDEVRARSILHMLKASTAFVGASRLAQATQTLSQALADTTARQHFLDAVSDYLAG